jgi:protein-disulfide isomerase
MPAVVTRILILCACLGTGWLGGTALRARSAVREVPIAVEMSAYPHAGMAAGKGAAGIRTLRIFGDYQCSSCRELERMFGDSLRSLAAIGRIQLIYHHAPLRTHPRGALAARVVYCAAEQGTGWAVHRAFYRGPARWTRAPLSGDPVTSASGVLIAEAEAAGADTAALRTCVESGRADRAVEQDRELADRLGIHAVPTLILGGSRLEFASFRALIRYITRHAT